MKYGYLFYQKPVKAEMKTRQINLGDPIQSFAVKNLYREMGIADEDIIPVPRYDLSNYNGEECVCVVNSASNYEELAYDSHFMPPSPKVHAVPMSLHIHRKLPHDELTWYQTCGGVGCRDLYTVQYLESLGVDAYLSGCLTLTFPKRTDEQEKNADCIYLIDVPLELLDMCPPEIRNHGIELTNIVRINIPENANRMSVEDTLAYHRKGEERIALLRDTARLVVTSRLHIATPCLAMGIPVILAGNHLGDRYGFIDRFIPAYTRANYGEIDYAPSQIDFEKEKALIKQLFFDKVRAAADRVALEKMWDEKKPFFCPDYRTETEAAVNKISFPQKEFQYAVWGIVLPAAFQLEEAMKKQVPGGKLIAGIDMAVTGNYCGVPIVKPEEIERMEKDTIIIVAAPAAHKTAKELLLKLERPFVLLNGSDAEWYGFSE